ncbi:antibiotic biosynthesis monooxygenase family protein [Virgibacillus sp. W0430]|uniref:antibiotic biosynthesis monooxygenase family protein n=1 Tax=Virgibacillus sp. W0430 TaxID=3391580 RepID=UPI003F45478E
MLFQIKRFVVKEGYAETVAKGFAGEGLIEKQPGFIDMHVVQKKVHRGDEEIQVIVRWDSEVDWKNWEKHPEHIAGHKARAGMPKPDYMIESSQHVYELQSKK